ncbi:MAG TPA: hypothetical protein VM324_06255 [Egibacteraceae bacterium]|nr:hypothetical protein [Egibacteraceae bacterium]
MTAPATGRGRAVREALDAAPTWKLFTAVAGPLLAVYLATASYGIPQSPDPIAAAMPAWQLVERGTLSLDASVGDNPWLVDTGERVVSNRQPGVIAWGVPFYALWPLPAADDLPMAPAGVAAAVAAALAMGVLALVLRHLVAPTEAMVAALVAGLGTATWTVSADGLWPHGPSQLWLGLALLALAGTRYVAAGLGFTAAIVTRPNAAVLAAVVGLYLAWRQRSVRPAVLVGAASVLGVVALVAYNTAVYGSPSIAGGYPSDFTDRLTTMTWLTYAENVVGTFVSPGRGILVLSPFLLVLAPGLRAGWRAAPSWVRGSALAGVLYLALHLRMNRFSGGTNFFSYRYPIESLTLAAPLLVLAWREWVAGSARRMRWLATAVAASFGVHALGALFFTAPLDPRSPWTEPAIVPVARAAGPLLVGAAVAAVAAVWVAAGRRWRQGR